MIILAKVIKLKNKISQDSIEGLQKDLNAINQKFNYSTTEKVVGKWIDGKPLYELTLSRTGKGNISISNLDVDVAFINISESFVEWISPQRRYYPVITTNIAVNPGSQPDPAYNQTGAYVNGEKTAIVIESGGGITLGKVVITIRYTKTTD